MEGELRGQGKPWRAFKIYRDLGSQRSLRAAAGIFYGRGEEGPTQSQYDQFKRWSARFDWSERIASFEAWLSMYQREAVEEHLRAKAQDHAQREVALREKTLRLRELAADQAEKMLAWPLVEQRVLRKNEDGVPVELHFFPAAWSKNTAVALYGLAMRSPARPEDDEAELAELDLSEFSEEELTEYLRLSDKLGVARRRERSE
jgi:hypothetical protein